MCIMCELTYISTKRNLYIFVYSNLKFLLQNVPALEIPIRTKKRIVVETQCPISVSGSAQPAFTIPLTSKLNAKNAISASMFKVT